MIEWISNWSERLLNLTLSRGVARSERERRSRSLIQGTIMALVARCVGSLAGLITVPLTVRYLGPERYGAWMTISSLLVFLGFTDFGLASSLTNALGKAFGEDDRTRARRYVTTTLITLCVLALLLVLTGITFARPIARVVFPGASQTFLNNEIVPTLILSLSIFAINFPLVITNRVLAAYQENATANIWIAASGIANLIGAIVAVLLRANLPMLVLATAGSGVAVIGASTVWLFTWHKQWMRPVLSAFDAGFLRELVSSGWKFFVISVGWMINSQTDNLIIAHFLGATAVTPYAVTFRLFAYATLIQSLAFPSLWPAYTEAAVRKDFNWIQGVYRKNLKFSLLIAICFLTVLTIFGRQIIRIWAGPAAVPSATVVVWMALWNLILAHVYVPSCLLHATGRIKGLTIYGTITAALNLALSILFVKRFGISGVIAGTVIAYAVGSYFPMLIEARRLLRRFATQGTAIDVSMPKASTGDL